MRKSCIIAITLLMGALIVTLPACSKGASPALTYGAEGSDDSLLVVESGNLYGFSDPTGKVVIKPQYTDARPFYEGLAAVKHGGKFGYIDKTGNTVLPFKYNEALDFHNGKAFVATEYIEHEAPVKGQYPNNKLRRPKYCIIDRNGIVLRETDYSFIGSYSDGVVQVYRSASDDIILVDENLKEVTFQAHDSYVTGFSDGLVVLRNSNTLEDTFVNYYGESSFQGKFSSASPFSEGLAAVSTTNGFGYINKEGIFVIAPQYKGATSFGNGLAVVYTKDGKTEMIDTTGNIIRNMPETEFSIEGAFSEGLCSVGKFWRESTNIGFMDQTGNLVVDCIYSDVTPFKNGIAEVKLWDGKIGYIDKTGKYIWEPK